MTFRVGTIRNQLLSIHLVGILGLSTIGYFMIKNSEQALISSRLEYVGDFLAHEADDLEQTIQGVNADLVFLANHAIIQEEFSEPLTHGDGLSNHPSDDWAQHLEEHFETIVSHESTYRQIRFIDIQGNDRIRVRSDGKKILRIGGEALQNIAEYPYFVGTMALPKSGIYASITPKTGNDRPALFGEVLAHIAIPVFNKDSNIRQGIFIIDLDVTDVLSALKMAGGGETYLIDTKGYYLRHPDASQEFGDLRATPYNLHRDNPVIMEKIAKKEQFVGYYPDEAEVDGFQKVFFDPGDKSRYWTLYGVVGQDRIFTGLHPMRKNLLLLGLTGLVGISLMLLAFAKRIIQPLRSLVHTTNAITSGNLKIRTAVRTNDEIGQLAKSLNRMTTTLDETLVSKTLLKKSEEQFRKIFVYSNEAIFLIDLHKDEIKEANSSACRMLGYTHEELLSKSVSDLHSDEMPAFRTFSELIYKNGSGWTNELTCRTKSGDTLPVEISASVIDLNDTSCIIALVRDISDRRKAEKWQRLISTVMKSTLEGIMVTDANDRILAVNPAFTKVTGYTQEEVIGENARILDSGLQDIFFYQEMRHTILEKGKWQGEVWNRRKGGETYAEWLSISTVKNHKGEITNYVGIFSEITSLKRREKHLSYLAFHDTLTGLPNRMLFYDRLRQAISQALRRQGILAVIFLDLDDFKTTNESLGRATGDLLLKSVARRLKEAVRGNDAVSRVGGDEFTIILTDITTTRNAEEVVKKIRTSLSRPFTLESYTISISASIGISFYPIDGSDVDTLIKEADTALSLAKKREKTTTKL